MLGSTARMLGILKANMPAITRAVASIRAAMPVVAKAVAPVITKGVVAGRTFTKILPPAIFTGVKAGIKHPVIPRVILGAREALRSPQALALSKRIAIGIGVGMTVHQARRVIEERKLAELRKKLGHKPTKEQEEAARAEVMTVWEEMLIKLGVRGVVEVAIRGSASIL